MAFAEDLSLFTADFGSDGLLAGLPVRGIFDAESLIEGFDGAVTLSPTFWVPTPSGGVAVGAVLTIPAGSYKVRQVLPDAPDGAAVRLVLTRA